ncbi:hypothetical protein DY000_02026590 [Brassica cretica]|uniref:Uncharacterized protein n=1 Tax=Brassica cretica TaxID=69181 RepID=A0ABQ7EDX0_BRACR|nr:hypothetical protein DY000_02026590 [Brassica cretica]
MGCGKSKHDVVTGNTRTVRKPLEAESVKGKENETIRKQESCQCQKSTDVAATVSADRPDTTLENNTQKEKEAEVDCGEKPEEKEAGEDEHKAEEKETAILPPVMAIVPENFVTEETSNDVNESVLIVDKQNGTQIIYTFFFLSSVRLIKGHQDQHSVAQLQPQGRNTLYPKHQSDQHNKPIATLPQYRTTATTP